MISHPQQGRAWCLFSDFFIPIVLMSPELRPCSSPFQLSKTLTSLEVLSLSSSASLSQHHQPLTRVPCILKPSPELTCDSHPIPWEFLSSVWPELSCIVVYIYDEPVSTKQMNTDNKIMWMFSLLSRQSAKVLFVLWGLKGVPLQVFVCCAAQAWPLFSLLETFPPRHPSQPTRPLPALVPVAVLYP